MPERQRESVVRVVTLRVRALFASPRVHRLVAVSVALYGLGFLVGGALGYTTGFVDASGLPGVTPVSERTLTISLSTLVVHNFLSVLLITLGFVSLGAITAFLGLQNGFFHGVVVGTMFVEFGSVLRVLALFVPHAVLELPAIWLATVAGLYVPANLYRYAANRQDYVLTVAELRTVLGLAALAHGLVITSSLVEYYVTFSFI